MEGLGNGERGVRGGGDLDIGVRPDTANELIQGLFEHRERCPTAGAIPRFTPHFVRSFVTFYFVGFL